MHSLTKQFEHFIRDLHLFDREDHLLLALSGGLDSVVLAHLLHTCGFHFSAAHCNFKLRGKDADEDAAFAKQYCKELGAPYFENSFETAEYAQKQKLSIQMAARALRYQWFDELCIEHNLTHLITAHHANDQVETILYNLTKGTGIAGMRGIPLTNDRIRRPLLFAKRVSLEQYADEFQLSWREDISNSDDKYGRNHIRHNVIPQLKKLNPNLENTVFKSSRRFEALEQLLHAQVSSIEDQHLTQYNDRYSLDLSWHASEGSAIVLTELLKKFGYSMEQGFAISACISSRSTNIGKQFHSGKFSLAIDRKSIEIVPKDVHLDFNVELNEDEAYISTPWSDFQFEISARPDVYSTDKQEAYLDLDLLNFPLSLRNWRQGDAFYPLGMSGKKKLSDFMIDEKIPVNLKSRVVLFESNNDIIWVAGQRIDDRYKITSATKRVLIIKMTNHV